MADGHGADGAGGDLHGHAATEFANTHLEQVAADESGRTFQDPRDGSMWVLEYPDGEGEDRFPRLRRHPG